VAACWELLFQLHDSAEFQMAGKITAAAAILLGLTTFASAQIILIDPRHSYWYGSGYYDPSTGTGVGEPPIYDYVPNTAPHHRNGHLAPHNKNWQKPGQW
jgi:hypothetical protein